ncbi:MAG: amino acid ABC transporter permease [Acidaminococcaceae bacterium]
MEKIFAMSIPLAEGSIVTLQLFTITLILSIPIGLLLALARISKIKPLSKTVELYNWIMRGSPLMLQLLFVYFALPSFGILLSDVTAAVLAFALNYAAYFAEIFRSGFQSIPKGQLEAARALGFTYVQTMRRIIVPQMIKRVLPPVGNETITLVKDTSLVYVLAMNDLLRAARTIVQREFDMTPFVIAGVFYLAMTFVVTKVFNWLENRYARYDE